MAQQTIDIGSAANDGTGDPIRDAFDKCNDNFTELYAGLVGLLDFKGSTDCSANPNYPAASKGDFYVVSVAGKIGGASGVVVEVGDGFFATADNAGGTQASVGSSWTVIQANIVGGTITELDDIPDVNAPSPSDGDALVWDNGAGEWVAAPMPGGGVGGTVPDGGTTGQVLTKQSNADQDVDWENTQALPSALFEDQKAANTAGGSSTSGSWLTRVLNTEVYDDIGLTLSSNQISLAAGTYEVEASGRFFATGRCRIRLQDVTNTATLVLSDSAFANTATGGDGISAHINGRFTLAGTATVELQYRVETSRATNGLGVETNFAVTEIYARLKLRKIA